MSLLLRLCVCSVCLSCACRQSSSRLFHTHKTLRMAGECVPDGPDLKEMDEEELWELINDNRHRISLGVRPCTLIPYLRQARVLTEMDEDEILSCHNLTNRCMRTSEILDLTFLVLVFSASVCTQHVGSLSSFTAPGLFTLTIECITKRKRKFQ